MNKKSCYISFSSFQPNKENVTIDDVIGIMGHWCHCQQHHMTESCVAPYFDSLDLANTMVLLMMSLASCDVDADANSITWQKSHVKPCSEHLDVMSTVVLLTMPMSLCDIVAGISGVIWLMKSYCKWFWSFSPNECSDTIDDAISIMCCQCQWHHMMKKSCCTSFQSSWCNKCSGAVDDTIGITWCWHKCQWHYMTRKSWFM